MFAHVLIFFSVIAVVPCICATDNGPLVLVVSLDGFRYDYISEELTPNIMEIRKRGIYSQYMNNVVPTFTFVNHWTMATGRFAGEHGVLANKVFDHKLQRLLGYSEELFSQNEAVIPIFTMNQMNGRHSGTMMWPGGEFKYSSAKIKATFVQPLENIPWEKRIETVVSWFKHKETPANFVMMYLDEPDSQEHAFGPESNETKEMIKKVDKYVAQIEQKLQDEGLSERINVIYVSDHGMDTVMPINFIDVTKELRENTYDIYGTSPVLQIVPKKDCYQEVLTKLNDFAVSNGHFKVYTQDNLPDEWRLMNKERFGPIIIVAEPKYAFQDQNSLAEWAQQTQGKSITPTSKYGIHGYPDLDEMRAMFMARGPLFKASAVSPVFSNVDLYQLICKLLRIFCFQTSGRRRDQWKMVLNNYRIAARL